MGGDDDIQTPHPRPISVLVIGANGYLGQAVCRAFLRAAAPPAAGPEDDDDDKGAAAAAAEITAPCPCPYRVYGLVRRPAAARDLSANEVTPIVVGELADTENTLREILAHSSTWDVIVTCTEPAKTDPVAEAEHWNAMFQLVIGLAEASNSNNAAASAAAAAAAAALPRRSRRPLVLWSSGCKDYGTTADVHGSSPGQLQPHTEASSTRDAPAPIRGRTDAALKALELAKQSSSHDGVGGPHAANMKGFDVAVIRATPVFGYSGSYFGAAFEYASRALNAHAANVKAADDVPSSATTTTTTTTTEDGQVVLKFTADAGTILHSLHVDDCAEAYVALATTALLFCKARDDGDGDEKKRASIAGEVFNISGRRYETLEEVGGALAAEYGFAGGARFGVRPDEVPGPPANEVDMTGQLVFGWSQWVSSDKIRKTTGWADRRPLFSENVGVYRSAYEAAKAQGNDNVGCVSRRMAGDWGERKYT